MCVPAPGLHSARGDPAGPGTLQVPAHGAPAAGIQKGTLGHKGSEVTTLSQLSAPLGLVKRAPLKIQSNSNRGNDGYPINFYTCLTLQKHLLRGSLLEKLNADIKFWEVDVEIN